MRVLHAASSTDPASGVARQMAVEQAAAERLGLDWTARFFVPPGTVGEVCVEARAPARDRIAFKREYYAWLEREMRSRDVLVLRYLRYDLFQHRFVRSASKPLFLVHHTLEGPQIVQEGGPAAWVKLRLDDALVRRCHARADGMIAVTDEIADYERARGARPPASCTYPNGITYDDGPVGGTLEAGEAPEFLFVASRFVKWHGLDLIIDAARHTREPFRLHVVGELIGDQAAALATDPRFVAHGPASLGAVEALAARCTLGLGSFALHRKNMHQACTLKVREYLRAGLPVYAGHADVFDDSMHWYRHGECDLERMIEYARECSGTSRARVSEEARPWMDKELLLMKLSSWIDERVGMTGAVAS